ncbi:pyruvate, phosphate dikinase [Paenactinomyces guangxiensis]|uniref:Pyruvate, phosphate dikinase n=1 Tax=Paenactinomyces guangxiensis TaxID=1490290 RepID=A0A7W1WNP5_9BACL|nr:pyruvate, phosphate dikinase [Paenactinomyces guangxiensis]MBA4493170.1 pyruvate, phosphate dikinase [Paenactinomyces guangxiensis]MBH8589980.1 pyruvate, phosphate dikinase [Paenactinomyces guangxiensis]
MTKKVVYLFREGRADMKFLLGGKGANLAEMTRSRLPVPPGFTISTEACSSFFAANETLTEDTMGQVRAAIRQLETETGKRLGDSQNPLLVSVRSGSVFSMPGMMDTILNLGLNDETAEGLAKLTRNPRFAYDCYRRFIQMFGDVVLGVDYYHFEQIIHSRKEAQGYKQDTEMSAEDWKWVIGQFKSLIREKTKKEFPQDPEHQLKQSIIAVFQSWNNQRAQIYRKIHKIPDHLGTAVNIQMMVFGNMGDDSGTGVAFTRNPSTGEKELYGEFLMNAQGEDVVAGVRTPQPIARLKQQMPAVYQQFQEICNLLEQHYHDMQDIEFTVERGQLYILQTRAGKRTAQAAVKIAVNMVEEGIIDRDQALMRVDPDQLNQMLHRRLDPEAKLTVIAKGLPASPGAASGKIVFDADRAEKCAHDGTPVILVRPETTPEDIHGILAAQGILTSRGGMTSHAAVVARGMGKACICGCEQLEIDLRKKEVAIGELLLREGDLISIDGSTGQVIQGEVPLIDPELSAEFKQLLDWADQVRTLQVRANADNPEDSAKARELGAEGIGLCRTEHMFMEAGRVPIVQQMILAETRDERLQALQKLLPMQKEDFKGIFEVMAGLPVNIRLLDPPLHEFLPNIEDLLVELTKMQMDEQSDRTELIRKEALLRKVRSLHEFNPMLGHRGCRLGLIYPEIYKMQAEAIFLAAAECLKQGIQVEPEIMIPLVGHVNELRQMRELVDQAAEEVQLKTGCTIPYTVGTMIEVPRAALTAGEIAEEADFFSFGTNDLTQTTFGYSRDDAEGKFLHTYVENKILPDNPFITLDTEGVGQLVRMGVEQGRMKKPGLKTGICGEHGGEKRSIQFCHEVDLNYVSCSPFRVPLARLSAAQAVIRARSGQSQKEMQLS